MKLNFYKSRAKKVRRIIHDKTRLVVYSTHYTLKHIIVASLTYPVKVKHPSVGILILFDFIIFNIVQSFFYTCIEISRILVCCRNTYFMDIDICIRNINFFEKLSNYVIISIFLH